MNETSLCGAWLYWFQSAASKYYRSVKPSRPFEGLLLWMSINKHKEVQNYAQLLGILNCVLRLVNCTILSVQSPMIGWLIGKGLKKKAVVAWRCSLDFQWHDWGKVRKPSGNDSSKNRTGYLPNSSLHYHNRTNIFTCNKCPGHRFRLPGCLGQSDW